ncbi:MAG: CBS domain-containing protein [Azospirillum sp.]|nr:CBS domain-containing protein [Azospirillum sp.]
MNYIPSSAKTLTVDRFLQKHGHAALTIHPWETVAEAAQHFQNSRHSLAVVVDQHDQVVGVLSLGDIAQALVRNQEKVVSTPVDQVMTSELCTARLGDDIVTLMQRMAEREIRHVPVVEDGRLKGLVTRKDALEGLYDDAAFELKYLTEFVFRSGARY